MKKALLILFFIGLTNTVNAQSDLKAKIKFEEAEKAFNDNDFNASLDRLNETERLLGKTNSKILYLKILSQNEIIKPDPYADFGMVVNIRKNSDTYMKMIEDKKDLYEKYKEVYKIKEDLEKYPKSQADFEIKKNEHLALKKKEVDKKEADKKEKEAFLNDLFERTNFTFEPNKSLDYYTSKYPEVNTFVKKAKITKSGDKTSYTFKLGIGRVFGKLFRVELSDITTRNNKVVYVSYSLMVGKNKETENISNEYEKLAQQAKNFYGSQPVKQPKYGFSIVYVESKELNFNLLIQYSFQSYDNSGLLSVSFYTDEMELKKWE